MPDDKDGKVSALIHTHIQRYPEMEILDVYKLLHQAVFGPGHALTTKKSAQGAREWIERECEILQPHAGDPLVEQIHPDRAVVRVHLRPYLTAKGKLDKLADGLIESSRIIIGDEQTMAAWWAIFEAMIGEADAPLGQRFDARLVALEGKTRANDHWPASHHSPRFEYLYRPAYRVLAYPVAEQLLRQQRIAFTVL